ncbi:hypothetical protein BBJ28_00015369 [Nothophytophthora sp. Chile5]|nr:hypothetical protein BBJ28_00015369 [Nothophytophthora sp. Chile5]
MPPGGGSSVGSLIYGGGDGESPFAGHERHTMRRKMEAPEQVNPYAKDYRRGSNSDNFNQPPAQQQQPPYQQPQQNYAQASGTARSGSSSSNQYANGSNQNAGNVLTDRRITRIHAPPGGASSIRFG